MVSGYGEIILRATGCTLGQVEALEELMREVVFHSTLDWQTRDELEEGARTAYFILEEMSRSPSSITTNHKSPPRSARDVEVEFRLEPGDYSALGAKIWMIAESNPGLRECRLEWLPGIGHYLILKGSMTAVFRAARMAGISEEEIRRELGHSL